MRLLHYFNGMKKKWRTPLCFCLMVVFIVRLILKIRAVEHHYSVDAVNQHDGCRICVAEPTNYADVTLMVVNGTSPTRDPPDYLKGPGIRLWLDKKPMDTAVCEWYTNSGTNHFPHEMEQLYRCWSWWNYHRQRNLDVRLVLHRSASAGQWKFANLFRYQMGFRSRRGTMFCRGFVDAVTAAFGVQVVSDDRVLSQAVRKGDETVFGGYAYRTGSVQDARDLAKGVTGTLGVPVTAGCSPTNKLPRVAILNRKPSSKRSILNAELIVSKLQQSLAGLIHPDTPVVYFENASFSDQVAFFSSVDLVISPHGAQLTGLPFLPDACAAVLEIFPKHYYYQQFFGSLAEAAGIKQYAFYLSDTDAVADFNTTVHDPRRRVRRVRRTVNLCPEQRNIVEAVKEMVSAWQSCCQAAPAEKQEQTNETTETTTSSLTLPIFAVRR